MVNLPADRLPSGVKHSDILKVLMVHCQGFSFDCLYKHVEAHQDETTAYHKLPREAQLNICMDVGAKGKLWGLVSHELRLSNHYLWSQLW